MRSRTKLLRHSFDLVLNRQPEIAPRFYEILFRRHPEARPLFVHKMLDAQQRMFQEVLVAVLDHLEDEEWLRCELGALGAKHLGYGVTPPMYDWIGGSLLATLQEIAGDDWSPEIADAWSEAFAIIASAMVEGARRAEEAAEHAR